MAFPLAPANGQVYVNGNGVQFTYDLANNAWTVTGGIGGGAAVLNDLGDVDTATTPPALNDILRFDGLNYVPSPGIPTPTAQYEILQADATNTPVWSLEVFGGTY